MSWFTVWAARLVHSALGSVNELPLVYATSSPSCPAERKVTWCTPLVPVHLMRGRSHCWGNSVPGSGSTRQGPLPAALPANIVGALAGVPGSMIGWAGKSLQRSALQGATVPEGPPGKGKPVLPPAPPVPPVPLPPRLKPPAPPLAVLPPVFPPRSVTLGVEQVAVRTSTRGATRGLGTRMRDSRYPSGSARLPSSTFCFESIAWSVSGIYCDASLSDGQGSRVWRRSVPAAEGSKVQW